jgi:hypothetical protein
MLGEDGGVKTVDHRLQAFHHFILSPPCDPEVLGQHLEVYGREILPQFR